MVPPDKSREETLHIDLLRDAINSKYIIYYVCRCILHLRKLDFNFRLVNLRFCWFNNIIFDI